MTYLKQTDSDFLDELAKSAHDRVDGGYYSTDHVRTSARKSLVNGLKKAEGVPIIAEVKFKSPAEGRLTENSDVGALASAYQKGGAAAISILTEPEHFDGNLGYLSLAKESAKLPVLMKDIVVDQVQIEACGRAGGDAILLIADLFRRRLSKGSLEALIDRAHLTGLEVVVEVHNQAEYLAAQVGRADIIGINNRDLRTLGVSTDTSAVLLALGQGSKPVICESGFSRREQLLALMPLGAAGFIIGTALMKSSNPEETLRNLVSG